MDALSAILLHNSLYKFSIAFYKDKEKGKAPLKAELHPLAWLLMLCDELQCWDRTAYGRNSRTELHPLAASFDFSNNAIHAVYDYDEAESGKIDAFNRDYAAWEKDPESQKEPRLKAYSDMAGKKQRFSGDIEKIVDLKDSPLTVKPSVKKINRKTNRNKIRRNRNLMHLFLSKITNTFLNLCFLLFDRSIVSCIPRKCSLPLIATLLFLRSIDQTKNLSKIRHLWLLLKSVQ